jgi:hypothetical protein
MAWNYLMIVTEKMKKELVDLVAQINNTSYFCTYGEANIAVKASLKMVQGSWVAIPMPAHNPRMSKEDAGKYYNAKLNKYWHIMLKDEIPIKSKREKIIKSICTNSIEYRRFCFSLKKRK